ncbi:MAG: repair protein RecO, repair protein RecO [Candidatus Kaiserbacteria bacterium]|nr:repair protein RecO, repair protein RecO [Candidatus Kaiserbacteria bacterium]
MYQKYSTEAIVLGSRERGEADRLVALYTQDFGLVWARAGAARASYSKMRYSITHYSRVKVSLIKGKRGWRLAGTVALAPLVGNMSAQSAFARTAALITRMVIGEEQHEYLYQTLKNAHETLATTDVATVPIVELVTVARVLHTLGYLSTEAVGTSLFTHTMLVEESLDEAMRSRNELLNSINRALSETHL